jgi:hypothetical protein
MPAFRFLGVAAAFVSADALTAVESTGSVRDAAATTRRAFACCGLATGRATIEVVAAAPPTIAATATTFATDATLATLPPINELTRPASGAADDHRASGRRPA